MNGAMPIWSTLFDFHPFEAHRVGGIVVVTHVARTPSGAEKRTFAALGTCLDDEVKLVGTYRKVKARSTKVRTWRARKANDARTRRRAEARAVKRKQEINVETIGDALPKEMTRIRDEVMPAYIAIGPSGRFALAMMRADLNAAAKAMAEGDVVEMLRVYKALREYRV